MSDPARSTARTEGALRKPEARDTAQVESQGSAVPWMAEHWWLGVAIAVGASFVWGLVAGIWTPRGPLTIVEGVSAIAVSFVVGAIAGTVLRSWWAMLLAPLAFFVVFELVRLDVGGPTVDGIQLSPYGLIALVVGRGVHAVLTLLPMIVGAGLGAGLVRWRRGRAMGHAVSRTGAYAGAALATVAIVGLALLAIAIARPGSTAPIVAAGSEPLPGSIAELTEVKIGGHEQAMMIRGHSTEDPVLLFLAGGPGGTELGAMRRHLSALEQDFVVATWDQRGTGKSYDELDPASTLTFEQAISDAIEVSEYLRQRFDKERIYLVGQSYGTLLGVRAAQRRPDLYHAYIGNGQMVSPRETDRITYEDTLAWARETGDSGLLATLTDIGPPPYQSILDYEPALSYERQVYAYDHSPNSEGEGGFSENLFVEEYTLLEQVHNLGAFLDTFSVLYPQVEDVDFREDATELAVPVYLVQGRHETRGRAELVEQWFPQLEAPDKRLVVFETSGHRPLFEQPGRFHEFMTEVVLPETQPRAVGEDA